MVRDTPPRPDLVSERAAVREGHRESRGSARRYASLGLAGAGIGIEIFAFALALVGLDHPGFTWHSGVAAVLIVLGFIAGVCGALAYD